MRSGETDAPALPAGRRRLSGEARRRLIVRQAALHFAESGFGATTRELAAALGVTQALLYRYFASKAEIVDAVFDAVFVADWDGGWDALLAERSLPLAERLTRFYTGYLGRRTEAETRLFMRAALDRLEFPARYTPALDERVLTPIARELRHELARSADAAERGDDQPAAPPAALPAHERAEADGSSRRLDPIERERVMVLHGGLVFLNVRRHIYGTVLPAELEPLVRLHVTTFLGGAAAAAVPRPPFSRLREATPLLPLAGEGARRADEGRGA